mmetsp:Transcript_129889/g.277321  ORF Transcript_129889/g.277321 Transcript_129889/m.277321 type:complete len:432 (-) Transcript_129889:149-1444(-)
MACDFLVMLLHFTIVENRSIFLLYFAYRTFLEDQIIFDATHSFSSPLHLERVCLGHEQLGDFVDCMHKDVEASLWHVGPRYEGDCTLITGPIQRMDLILNCSALFIGILFFVVMILMLCASGAKNFGEGRYLAFSFEMRQRQSYKIMSGIEMIFVVYILIRTCYSVAQDMSDGRAQTANQFLFLYGTDAFLLLYSAAGFFKTHKPCYDYNEPFFESLQFRRGFAEVFTETNSDFSKKLEISVFKAEYGFTDDLQAILEGDDPKMQTRVMEACLPRDLLRGASSTRAYAPVEPPESSWLCGSREDARTYDNEALVAIRAELDRCLYWSGGLPFETCSPEMKPLARETIGKVARILKQHPHMSLRVLCFCDELPEHEAETLSDRRAREVKRGLEEEGCQNYIQPRGMGFIDNKGPRIELEPVDPSEMSSCSVQ